jgi:hypothetical protein
MKSSNNQKIIDEMEFWYFNNYMIYFLDNIEKENGSKSGSTDDENSPVNQFNSSMSSAKSLMKTGFKMPKK